MAFAGTADLVGVGVCSSGAITDANVTGAGTAGCTTNGYLINTQEVKAQFAKRPYFKSSALDADKMYLYKAVSEPSVSVCFIPASKATRDRAGGATSPLKDLNVTAGGIPTTIEICTVAPTATEWADPTTACFVCIPEE